LFLLLLVLWIALAFCDPAEAYIGPGAGFAFLGSFTILFVTIILAFGTILLWPLRALYRVIVHRRALTHSLVDRVIVVGLDGLDPELAERFIEEGKLPTLKKLKEEGCFRPLMTTVPSMSPVAWSSFQTGVDPSKHNIYDFLTRDPKNYLPALSSTDIRGDVKVLKIGKLRLPLPWGKSTFKLLRKGVPFWKILGKHRIFSSIIRVPITFPPEKFNGVCISAMCVPDLRGSQGTFTLFTTEECSEEATQGVRVPVTMNGSCIRTEITGPANPLKDNNPPMTIPLIVEKEAGKREARITAGDETFTLQEKEYSPWIRLTFKAGAGMKVTGICRFYVMEFEPEFKLYMTPINIDPDKPSMPISHPFIYAVYLAKKFGPYATLGLAEDTWALNERAIDEEAFLKQAYLIHEEREKMMFDAIEKTKKGCVVTVFDATDRIQHMFMRYLDPTHPANRDKDTEKHKNAIEDLYVRMDDLVKRTLDKCDDKTVVMVISDHGFKLFRRGINLNSWLMQNGYLHLKDGKSESGEWFEDVDWSRTKAFSLGLTGIFLNLKGREAQGIVKPGEEEEEVKRGIIEGLSNLYDDEDQKQAIRDVFDSKKLFNGPFLVNAPDLLIGYENGYRASWDCAVGKVSEVVIDDNVKSWSGDHCIDPRIVPGIFFCNRKIDTEEPRLMDVGPTILRLFGVPVPAYMDGVSLINGDREKPADPARKMADPVKQ